MTLLALFQLLFLLGLLGGTSAYLVLRVSLRLLGWYLIHSSKEKRQLLLGRLLAIESRSGTNTSNSNKEQALLVGFFHPFCNAGGGGERVLWAAIQTTQKRYPNAICVVYTGDSDADKEGILTRVKERFNIHNLEPSRIVFLYVDYRNLVSASLYPHFTLLLQSLGSLPVAYSAFSLLVPDVFIDTMGYPFTYPFTKAVFGAKRLPVSAYVHYPTISTDMLDSLDENASFKLRIKKIYWRLFARLYRICGAHVDVVTANSTWTARHISELWGLNIETIGPSNERQPALSLATIPEPDRRTVKIVFPPCSVEDIINVIPVDDNAEIKRRPHILCIAQFRPEKRHELLIRAFAKLLKALPSKNSSDFPHDRKDVKLILLGSVRTNTDEDTKIVYSLRILVRELGISNQVEFVTDASWVQVLDYLRTSWVGTNAMWNEHFGIGVVEYQAAGLICVVHNSGGPKEDIVVEVDGERTGWHADDVDEFAEGFRQALSVHGQEKKRIRERCRKSSLRFAEKEFGIGWEEAMERLIGLKEGWSGGRRRWLS